MLKNLQFFDSDSSVSFLIAFLLVQGELSYFLHFFFFDVFDR